MKRHTLTAENSTILATEGNLKVIHNEDGEYLGHFPAIFIRLWLDGEEYVNNYFLEYGYCAMTDAEAFIDKIERRGSVNLEKWQHVPARSFEEKYLENMAYAEREEREAEGYRYDNS